MVQINGILGSYILVVQQVSSDISKRYDICKIDFDLLKRGFAKVKKRALMIMDLDAVIQECLASILKTNHKRVDYYERYQQIIEEYNSE